MTHACCSSLCVFTLLSSHASQLVIFINILLPLRCLPSPLAARRLSPCHAATGRSAALWPCGNEHRRAQQGRLVRPAFSEEIRGLFGCRGKCRGPRRSSREAGSWVARLSAASDCADAVSPRQDAARETVSCSRREGVILGGSGTSRVNCSSRDFFLV